MYWKKIMIYDDAESFVKELKEMLITLLPDAEIVTATTSEEALANMENCDLLFLDVELENNRSGIDFFQYTQKRVSPYLPVIFISGYIHNVEKIFAVEPDGYLIKPVTPSRLKLCLEMISKKTKKDKILIPIKNGMVTYNANDIMYIENDSRYARFYSQDGTELLSAIKFKDLSETIPEYFCHCHKSFYVNLYHVKSMQRYVFTLDDGCEVSVSQSKYSESKQLYTRFIGKVL